MNAEAPNELRRHRSTGHRKQLYNRPGARRGLNTWSKIG